MADIEVLKKIGTIRRYEPDDCIVYEGEEGEEMYIILSGKVSIYINSYSDYPVKIADIGPGEIFGEMSILENLPRSATAVADDKVDLLTVKKENLILFIEKQPEMAYKMMKTLCSRIRSANEAMKELQNQCRIIKIEDKDYEYCKMNETSEECKIIYIDDGLYPKGHKAFNRSIDGDNGRYLYKVKCNCPMCDNEFESYAPKISKLIVKKVDKDFRSHYEDGFDPLWYNIQSCPKCYYSSYYHDFYNTKPHTKSNIIAKTASIRNKVSLKLEGKKNIDQIFTQYFLAIACTEAGNSGPLKLAKLWMHVAWLYKDMEYEEMYKKAGKNALRYYLDTYHNSVISLKPNDEQQLCIIIAELYMLEDKKVEALNYLKIARTLKNRSNLYTVMAELRTDEIKL